MSRSPGAADDSTIRGVVGSGGAIRSVLADALGDAVEDVAVRAALFGGEPDPVRVGRFVALSKLGAGAFGTVLLAYDTLLDRRVALKIIRGREATWDADALLNEARALAQLEHPNVVSVYDALILAPGTVAIAMEYVDGESLHAWLHGSDGRHAWRDVVDAFGSVAQGMRAAHAADVVHRDLKPANVMVGRDGRVRVADFGLAEIAAKGAATPAGAGTPVFMPPEALGGRGAGKPGDVYAFFVSLFIGLVGRNPFERSDLGAMLARKAAGGLELPAELGFPRWLRRLVLAGTAADPEQRPTFDDVCRELARRSGARGPWLLAGAVLSLAATLVFSAGRTGASTCDEAVEAMAQVWSDARRADYVGRGAEDVAGRALVGQLDAFVGAWRREREAACNTESRDHDDARVQRALCLDAQLETLRASLDAFDASGSDSAVALSSVVDVLADPVLCSHADRFRHLEPPDDPALAAELWRRRVHSIALVAAVTVREDEGALADLLALLDDPVVRSHPPLRAELALEAARVSSQLVPATRQLELLRETVLISEGYRLDGLLFAGLVRRAALRAMTGDLDAAVDDLDRAEAVGRRVAATPSERGWVALRRAQVARGRRDHEAAIASLKHAIALADEPPGDWGLRVNGQMTLASLLIDTNRPEAALALLVAVDLDAPGMSRPSNRLAHAMLSTAAYRSIGNLELAAHAAERTFDALAELGNVQTITRASALGYAAQVAHLRGDSGQAEALLRRAADIERSLQLPINAARLLGNLLRDLGRTAEALQIHQQARDELVARIGPDRIEPLFAEDEITEDLQRLGRCAEAVPRAELALLRYVAYALPEEAAGPLHSRGRCRLAGGDTAGAVADFTAAASLKSAGDDPHALAQAQAGLGEALLRDDPSSVRGLEALALARSLVERGRGIDPYARARYDAVAADAARRAAVALPAAAD
ncbi:MAG: protein kinase [Nannocystaceae bacterium]